MEHGVPVRSVKKALDILDLVIEANASGSAVSLAALAQRLSMPRNSAHNLLKTLAACGYVEQHDRGLYIPGSKCRQLVRLSQFDNPVTRAAIDAAMRRFVDSQGEACVLTVLVNGQRIVVNYLGSNQAVRVAHAEIERDSFYEMPTGRMLAAIADKAELQQIIQRHDFPRARWNNIADEAALQAELALLRQQGYCRIANPGSPLVALACPVFPAGTGTGESSAAAPAWGAVGAFEIGRASCRERV